MSTVASEPHEATDVRPVVRVGGSGKWGPWLFTGALALLALFLFQALDSRRRGVVAPSTTLPADGNTQSARITSPPPLVLPNTFADEYDPDPFDQGAFRVRSVREAPEFGQSGSRTITRVAERAATATPETSPPPSYPDPVAPPTYNPPPAPQVVYDRTTGGQLGGEAPSGESAPSKGADRVRASRLAAPGFTVSQGTVIAAVLETALDSTKPGFARALVSRDVVSFDGTRVLIPRGSRLVGEYEASLEPGQNRALIRWSRLTRPDGVRMELDSPSADALGRAGVRGKVDTKFLQRFSGTILQSVLDIGVGLATRPVRDRGIIVALPGSSQVVTPAQQQQQVKPTLRVKQGTRVTVFVARDLDFSDVDR